MDSYHIRYEFGDTGWGHACVIAKNKAQAVELIEARIGTKIKVLESRCLNSADTAHIVLNEFQG